MNNIVRNVDGKVLPFDYIKDNKDVIVPIISEGHESLEGILSFCVSNDLPTIACCAGHSRFDMPYITMVYDVNSFKRINGFLNRIKNIHNVRIMFSSTGFTSNKFCVTVYSDMSHRDTVFSVINECLRSNICDEYLYNDVHVCLDIALTLDLLCETCNISVYNGLFKRRFMVNLYEPLDKNGVLGVNSSSYRFSDSSKSSFYLYKNYQKMEVINNYFKQIYDSKFCYPCLDYDGFHCCLSSYSGVYDRLKKIDYINSFLEKKNGSVSRGFFK